MLTRKAVVVETGKGWAIVLLPGGEYKRIKTNQYLEVGELYRYRNYAGGKYLAAAVIFLTILFGSIDYYTVQAYAEISSLELGINRWGRVISVQARDAQGQRIMSKVKIKNEPLENAVQKITRIEEKEKPDSQVPVDKPSVKVHAKGGTKPELEGKILEKINQGQEKATHAKNKNEKKQELKTESELQNSDINNSNKQTKQESPENPEPVGNNSEVNLKPNDSGEEKQAGKAKLDDEELPVNKNKPATPTLEVLKPNKTEENKKNTDDNKQGNNQEKDTNQGNNNQGNNQKNDNNRKK